MRRFLASAFLVPLALALSLTACAPAPFSSTKPPPPNLYDSVALRAPPDGKLPVFVLDTGWHTGWAVPAKAFLEVVPALRRWFSSDQELMIGWGNRSFYMAHHPGILTGLSALLPSSSVVLVQGISARDWQSQLLPQVRLFPLRVSRIRFLRLAHYVVGSLKAPLQARGFPKSEPWYPGGEFFRSWRTYDAAHTCNTWTTGSLQYMGFPVSPVGVLFAGQVQSLVHSLSASSETRSKHPDPR